MNKHDIAKLNEEVVYIGCDNITHMFTKKLMRKLLVKNRIYVVKYSSDGWYLLKGVRGCYCYPVNCFKRIPRNCIKDKYGLK